MELSEHEARVMGCLMEKSVVTPDQYPMTLNALTSACNQKSSRDPVMSLESGLVLRTVRSLESKHLLRTEENFKTQVEKYTQRLCNTPFSDYTFDAPQFAIVCVLLLRGARTPGELRANSGRLHSFEDNSAVMAALMSLLEYQGGPLVEELPRTPGRRDSEFMHLLSGPVEVDLFRAAPALQAANSHTAVEKVAVEETAETAADTAMEKLERRVTDLEYLVSELRRQTDSEP